MHQASFASAAIYLVRELEGVFPSLRPFIDQHQEAESEEEEDFRDVLEDGGTPDGRTEAPMRASNTKKRPLLAYDGRKRDPQHSNADGSCVWELVSGPYRSVGYS